MRYFYLLFFFGFLVFLLIVFSCKSQKTTTLAFLPKHQIIILDSLSATKAIVVDEKEHFFEAITALEMNIQMRNNDADKHENLVKKYKKYLQEDVVNFTETDREFVNAIFEKAFKLCNAVNKDIFPKKIRLIKTKGKYYGNSVYYTREDIIVIPENALNAKNKNVFLEVMLHEIFHIYSRYNESKRHELYALIGFKPLDAKISRPDVMQKRLLCNPDGINCDYYIDLENAEGKKIKAIPSIVSNKNAFDKKSPSFFSYVSFNLFEIQKDTNGTYQVLADNNGFSTINMSEVPNFFKQIKDNTSYIIHPDEILADNFKYIMMRNDISQYSEEGAALLRDIKATLTK